MTNNIELSDTFAVQYDIARLLRVFTVFPKIEEIDDGYNVDETVLRLFDSNQFMVDQTLNDEQLQLYNLARDFAVKVGREISQLK